MSSAKRHPVKKNEGILKIQRVMIIKTRALKLLCPCHGNVNYRGLITGKLLFCSFAWAKMIRCYLNYANIAD